MRSFLKRMYRRQISGRLQPFSANDLGGSALVFAPHQDDETLGCGGTILKKTEQGAGVKIIFMTNGSTSHSHLMDAEELSTLRRHEAVAASQLLGVPADDVSFLGFPDGQLLQCFEPAVERISEVLVSNQPEQVFIPYANEPHADHEATNQIVRYALAATGSHATIYEYPVWAWYHWPWVSIPLNDPKFTRFGLRTTVLFALGLRILRTFDSGVYIGDIITQKQLALAQHRSQMSQLIPNVEWLTLESVGKGDWLTCFFQDYELFRRSAA